MAVVIRCLVAAGLLFALAGAARAGTFDCSVVYDEFDSLMNKTFLLKPENYVKVARGKLSREDYNGRQRDKLLLSESRKGWGVAVVHTNADAWGKFLFTWGGRGDARGTPLLILQDVTLYGSVQDGARPRVASEYRVSAAQSIDLDTGSAAGGDPADVLFRNVDGKTMYVEAVNGATLAFPMESLCR